MLEKFQLVKEMITRMVVFQIIVILNKNYKIIVINLSKQQALDVDPRAIQQIIFTANLEDYHQI